MNTDNGISSNCSSSVVRLVLPQKQRAHSLLDDALALLGQLTSQALHVQTFNSRVAQIFNPVQLLVEPIC